jgi:hypothetical protein
MEALLFRLTRRLVDSSALDSNAMPRACPKPSFGDVTQSRIATLGFSPSNREFEDKGIELDGQKRRFPTLGSLGIDEWSAARPEDLEKIWTSCRDYFLPSGNPYNLWFKPLDQLLSYTGASYYEPRGDACHLDLVPYATKCKWAKLDSNSRSSLLRSTGTVLGELLRDSPVQILVLNGRSVVKGFERMAGISLQCEVMDHWRLRQRGRSLEAGRAFTGVVNALCGIPLGRELVVIGFSHNIQAMRGVNVTDVKKSIGHWIGGQISHLQL